MEPNAQGLITLASAHAPAETLDRLSRDLAASKVRIFARIDHAAGARDLGMQLRPTELLIFGNPLAGTPLMQSRQTMGIDLPLRALAWQDEAGKSWLSYTDPAHLAARHGVTDRQQQVNGMTQLLQRVAASAVGA